MFNWFLLVQNVSKTAIDFDPAPKNREEKDREKNR